MDDYLSEAEIAPSARKHGVTDEDIRHALRHYWISRSVGDPNVVMYVGPSRAAHLLEIGVVYDADGVAIVHAMVARKKYLL